MNLRYVVATLSVGLCVAACGDGETPRAATSVGDGEAAAADLGAQLFDANCSGCHALGGSGSAPGPNLAASRPSEEEIVSQIANGGGGMPSFRDKLTSEQIMAIAAFVEEAIAPDPA